MAGTEQIEFTLSGQSTDFADPSAARIFIERIVVPVLQKVRNTTNQLVRKTLATAEDTFVQPKYGFIAVDASTGPRTITLPSPNDVFHLFVVVKTDATANAVTIQSYRGELISGASTLVLSDQWNVAILDSDATQYIALSNHEGTAPDEPEIRVNLSSDQTLWSPAGWSAARRVYVNVTTACNVFAMDPNVTQRLKSITHVGTTETPLGFYSESVSAASVAGRIRIPYPNDLYMLLNWEQDFFYDTTDARWRPV